MLHTCWLGRWLTPGPGWLSRRQKLLAKKCQGQSNEPGPPWDLCSQFPPAAASMGEKGSVLPVIPAVAPSSLLASLPTDHQPTPLSDFD